MWARFPPQPRDARKRALFTKLAALPPPSGPLVVSRWADAGLPETFAGGGGPALSLPPSPIAYLPDPPDAERWVVNFACSELFMAYGGPALAQDELQVVEHPILASVRQRLCSEPDSSPLRALAAEDGRATPVLIEGAERVAELDLRWYGHRFRTATPSQVERDLLPLVPRTRSRILAMESIPFGSGWYALDEVRRLVATATAGFRAAVRQSRARDDMQDVIVHSGFWGCGAYGGSRVLSGLVQMLAAKLADVDELVLHALDTHGVHAAEEARDRFAAQLGQPGQLVELEDVLEDIVDHGYRWGRSDGT